MIGNPSYALNPFVINVSMQNNAQSIDTGNRLGGWLRIDNESPYSISIFIRSSFQTLVVAPQTIDIVQVTPGDQVIYVTPTLFIPGSAPSSQINIIVYPEQTDPPPGSYPMVLARQSAPVSAASRVGFVASAILTPAIAGDIVAICIFNPSTSRVLSIFYEGIFTSNDGTDVPNLGSVNTDPHWFSGVIALSSATIQPPFNSQMSVSATNDGLHGATVFIVDQALTGGNSYNFITYPHQVQLSPGFGVVMLVSASSATSKTQLSMKWTEQGVI